MLILLLFNYQSLINKKKHKKMAKEVLKLALGVALGVIIANFISAKVPMLKGGASYEENLDAEEI